MQIPQQAQTHKRPEVRKLNTTGTAATQNRAQPITTPPCSYNFSPFKVQTDHSIIKRLKKKNNSRRKKENQTLKKHDRSRQDQAIL